MTKLPPVMSLTICATFIGALTKGVRVLFQVIAMFQWTFFASAANVVVAASTQAARARAIVPTRFIHSSSS